MNDNTTNKNEMNDEQNLARAYDLLQKLLLENGGLVSSRKLKQELLKVPLPEPEARQLMTQLQSINETIGQSISRPDARTYHAGWNFYSKEKYKEALAETEQDADARAKEAEWNQQNLAGAYDLLQKLLSENEGVVASVKLRRALESGLSLKPEQARQLTIQLQSADGSDEIGQSIGRPDARTYHLGWNFYSQEKYQEALAETEQDADANANEAESSDDVPEEESERKTRQNRKEEAKLCEWVERFLREIYDSDFVPVGADAFVFDVHNEREGGTFENVDLLAIDWRTDRIVDLVTVEVKLQFDPKAVQQACNYTRFSNRVWVATVVRSDISKAGMELRTQNPSLFDYAVLHGLGIIACRRRPGRDQYEGAPIHWPMYHEPSQFEREQFMERYGNHLEEAKAVEPRDRRVFPLKLRGT